MRNELAKSPMVKKTISTLFSFLGGLCTNRLAAAILDFGCGMRANNIDISSTEKPDLEDIRILAGI